MSTADRIIPTPDPEAALAGRAAVELPGNPRAIINPAHPGAKLPAGDPFSPSGFKVARSELDDDVLADMDGADPSNWILLRTLSTNLTVPADHTLVTRRLKIEDGVKLTVEDTGEVLSL